MTYPYGDRDLFETPEFYHYARCQEPGFLAAWRLSRQRLMDELPQPPAPLPDPCPEQVSDEAVETGSVAHGLTSCIRSMQLGKVNWASTQELLDRLVHKFEVSRRLYRRYAADGARLPGVPPAGLGTYLLFGLALAAAYGASAGRDLQKASTLLKLCDALASKGAHAYTAGQAFALLRLLRLEREIVDGLAGSS